MARPSGAPPVIELDRVTFSYPQAETPTLTDISLRVEPGEFLGIVGPTGVCAGWRVRRLRQGLPAPVPVHELQHVGDKRQVLLAGSRIRPPAVRREHEGKARARAGGGLDQAIGPLPRKPGP